MKHFINIGLGLLVVIGLMLGTATEVKADWIVHVPTDIEAYRLDPVDFDITIDDATLLESLDITLTYDTSVLQYVNTTLGTVWADDASPTLLVNTLTPGTLIIGAYPWETLSPDPVDGTLIEIDFQVLDTAPLGPTYIPFTEFLINESHEPGGVEDGIVEIIPEPSSLLLLVIGALTLAFVARRV